MPTHVENIFINSGNASQIDAKKSRIHINLSNPIKLPADKRVMARVISSSIWFDNPNVLTGVNDVITITLDGTLYTWTMPQGLYSLNDIQESIDEFGVNATPPIPAGTITLSPDEATGKISLKATFTTITWNFEASNTLFKALLGFTGTFTASTGEWQESTNVARLNNTNAYLFHCSFVNGGYLNTNSGQNICHIVVIPSATTVGSQIVSQPSIPVESVVNEKSIDSFVVYVTTEDGVTSITTSEDFTLHMQLYLE